MKTVKSNADLNKMALRTGARVEDESGNQFNTEKKKAVAPRRMEPEVPLEAPPPPPKPEKPDLGSVKVAETIVDASRTSATMLQQIKEQISKIQLTAPEPITHWEFDFIRDDKGYIVRLIADGGAPIKILN
jgi:hypothetical protein